MAAVADSGANVSRRTLETSSFGKVFSEQLPGEGNLSLFAMVLHLNG
jgi:hypothetical protein